MKLSARLMRIAQFVLPGSFVADIGTDHALLPIYLVKQNIASKVICGELNSGPLNVAFRNVEKAGLDNRITLRLGNGFDIVNDEDIDVCVIAGMGGPTIRDIIKKAGQKAGGLKQLILQPMGGSGPLREWLAENGWLITEEDLIKEDGHIYEIISALRGPEIETDRVLVSVGPRLVETKHPLLIELLAQEIKHNIGILTNMGQSDLPETFTKLSQLKQRTESLERIITCLLNARQS